MSRPYNRVPDGAEYLPAGTIRTRLGISVARVRKMALAQRVRTKTAEAVIGLHSGADVPRDVAEKTDPGRELATVPSEAGE